MLNYTMFELNPTVPKEVKKYRKYVTKKYGYITLVLALGFITTVVIYNSIGSLLLRNKKTGKKIEIKWRAWIPFVWTLVLLIVSFKETMNDWTFLVKRLGRVSVALLPPTYLLSLKPSPFPKTLYQQLLPFHKWCSRTIVLLGLIHGILYTWIYFQNKKLFKLLHFSNVCGILLLTGFLTMALSSLKPVRKYFYSRFYTIHYTLSWAVVVFLWFHSKPPSNEYILMCIIILGCQIGYRYWYSTHTTLPVQYISPTLLMIKIEKQNLPTFLQSHSPGAHLRISNPLWNFKTWMNSSHPYTITSMPHDEHLTLIIRKTNFSIQLRREYALFGTFDSLQNQFMMNIKHNQINRALFVIGGSGIAFGAPIMRFLQSRGVSVKMLWAVRDIRDVQALYEIGLSDSLQNGDVEVYITSTPVHRETHDQSSSVIAVESHLLGEPHENNEDDLDVSVDNLYCPGTNNEPTMNNHLTSQNPDIKMYNHRPVLTVRLKMWLCGWFETETETDRDECDGCAAGGFTTEDTQGSWVIASGAERLVNETKSWASDNNFEFYQEEFAL